MTGQLDILNALAESISRIEQQRRLALHATGRHCPACGSTRWPHIPTVREA
ncbi:hypothetical protein WKY82_10440 [Gordonia malaquae]|uniref:hypothetical protein n=1 Tax=Gordonia malaquae TaxID=410332 RepID=UPI0030C7917D